MSNEHMMRYWQMVSDDEASAVSRGVPTAHHCLMPNACSRYRTIGAVCRSVGPYLDLLQSQTQLTNMSNDGPGSGGGNSITHYQNTRHRDREVSRQAVKCYNKLGSEILAWHDGTVLVPKYKSVPFTFKWCFKSDIVCMIRLHFQGRRAIFI